MLVKRGCETKAAVLATFDIWHFQTYIKRALGVPSISLSVMVAVADCRFSIKL